MANVEKKQVDIFAKCEIKSKEQMEEIIATFNRLGLYFNAKEDFGDWEELVGNKKFALFFTEYPKNSNN